MPRRRIHIPGGTYYVVRRTHSDKPIFENAGDYSLAQNILPSMLRRTGARLLAYCWMPDAMHLALQVDTAPVGDFMRTFTSQYAQQVHRRTGERGQLFRRPYEATLIDPKHYLRSLVAHLHFLPVRAGIASEPADYLHSSYRAYAGLAPLAYLDNKWAEEASDGDSQHEEAGRAGFATPPCETHTSLLQDCVSSRSGILGDPDFRASLPRQARSPRSQWSLESIAAHIAQVHDVTLANLRSRSRRQELVVARAVFAWYATERRVASLSEVARYLGRSASSLTRAVARHQRLQPELFSMHAFAPLAPVNLVRRTFELPDDDRTEYARTCDVERNTVRGSVVPATQVVFDA